MVECLPGTYSDEHPPKHEPISVSSGCHGLSMTRRMFMGPDAHFVRRRNSTSCNVSPRPTEDSHRTVPVAISVLCPDQ